MRRYPSLIAAASALVVLVAPLAPAVDIAKCSKPDYRQTHLAECNSPDHSAPVGGGPHRGGGLLGGLLGALGL